MRKDRVRLTDTSEGRSARRGVRLPSGGSGTHHGKGRTGTCTAKFKLSLWECPASAAKCCFCRTFRKAGSRGTCGRLRSQREGGVRPGRAEPRRLQGKFFWQREGRHLGGSSPGTAQPDPGVCKKARSRAGAPATAAGASLLGGVSAGGGGRN
jgi:hypothetical protein